MNTPLLIGRHAEKAHLLKTWHSAEAELIALYGRRRVGKTHLVRAVFQDRGRYMEVIGLKDGSLEDQLAIFIKSLQETFYRGIPIQKVAGWKQGFELLTAEVRKLRRREKLLLFLDELPWLATPKSGLLQALDHYWNRHWSQMGNLKVVLCGSAASWMLENLIHAKGGLHNRVTLCMRLLPFSLAEAESYLAARGLGLNRRQILELYMAMGGIPYYLHLAEKGKSAAQIIDQTCFAKGAMLRDEFERLFPSLFDDPEGHALMFREIVRRRGGIGRTELLEKTGMPTGGGFNRKIRALEEAGFISSFVPYGRRRKEGFFRATDEFSLFHSTWIAHAPRGVFAGSSPRYWEQKRATPAWRSWAGYAFESICLKHSAQIRKALGIDSIGVDAGSWRYVPPRGSTERGCQIDLLFDRTDGAFTLCEIKHSDGIFTIDKGYADELQRKIEVFRARTKTRKQLFLGLITTHGAAKYMHYGRLVAGEVTLDQLFSVP
ncbi:MAG: ATP-binding protein [Elusimicrobia bacterium]|nr:ATP-binding protein [Elusimicrobiota bacterium]